jgi:uncharacterized protein (TIGR03083 family)
MHVKGFVPVKMPQAYGVVSIEAGRLLAAACDDLAQQIPTCPGWDQFRLVGHQARVFHMASTVLERRLTERPTADLLPDVPDSPAVVDYFVTARARILAAIQAADPEAPVWTFGTGPAVAEFWGRRMAHEVTIHRIDAERGAEFAPAPITAEHAVDGINELLDIFSVRIAPTKANVDLGGSLHFHCTDTEGEWMVSLNSGVLHVDHAHGKGAAAIRGTAADLYLGLWGRLSLSEGPMFERFGNPDVVSNWVALGGF